jgi:hypothetical protein
MVALLVAAAEAAIAAELLAVTLGVAKLGIVVAPLVPPTFVAMAA